MARTLAGLFRRIVGQCAGIRQAVDDEKRHIQRLLSDQEAENIGGFDQEEHFLLFQQSGLFFLRYQ